jgi:hypothetical protein
MAVTEITSVEAFPVAPELLGFNLEGPEPGSAHDAYALDVRGWVLGRDRAVTSVEVKDGDRLLRRIQTTVPRPELADDHADAQGVERAGFVGVINALALASEFEILVRARLEDKTRVKLATVRGRRAALRSPFEARIEPLMVTTLGRTGSTILMKVLSTHPGVVAYRPFEQEPRVATYWLGVMSTLTDPASYRRQINPSGSIDGTWWVGTEPPLPRRLKDPRLTRWMGVDAVQDVAAFCQARIEALYAETAAAEGIAAPAFFAEKFRPDRIPEMMHELYPRAREVILVRDFRDMVASMFAYNAKRGREGFRRDEFDSDADYVVKQISGGVRALAAAWAARRDRAHLVRYEDLVLEPEQTVAGVLRYLGLGDSGPAADRMVKALRATGPETAPHRTTTDPRASIGRWRTDLSPDARAACEAALGDHLQAFGYTLEEATAR